MHKMMQTIKKFGGVVPRLALAAALTTGMAACDSPIEAGGEHPDGLVVVNASGSTVATYDHESRSSTGSLSVAASGTQRYRVLLTTPQGRSVAPDGINYSVQARVLLQALASATVQAATSSW